MSPARVITECSAPAEDLARVQSVPLCDGVDAGIRSECLCNDPALVFVTPATTPLDRE
jgi:hypothetical protein